MSSIFQEKRRKTNIQSRLLFCVGPRQMTGEDKDYAESWSSWYSAVRTRTVHVGERKASTLLPMHGNEWTETTRVGLWVVRIS